MSPGLVVVVMGVAGSGKSTIGAALAARLGVAFVDADDLHDAAAIEQMASGRGLTEAQRVPWLDRVHERLSDARDVGVVCACSALTEAARRRLVAGLDGARFVWLTGRPELIAARLAHRLDHPVGIELLPSQMATLEPPDGETVVVVDVDAEPPSIVDDLAARLAP